MWVGSMQADTLPLVACAAPANAPKSARRQRARDIARPGCAGERAGADATVCGDPGTPTRNGTSFGAGHSGTRNAQGRSTGGVPVHFGSASGTFWVLAFGSADNSAAQVTPKSKPVTVSARAGKYAERHLLHAANDDPLNTRATPQSSEGRGGKARTAEIGDWCTLAVGKSLSRGTALLLQATDPPQRFGRDGQAGLRRVRRRRGAEPGEEVARHAVRRCAVGIRGCDHVAAHLREQRGGHVRALPSLTRRRRACRGLAGGSGARVRKR